jgi:hypothetical protein
VHVIRHQMPLFNIACLPARLLLKYRPQIPPQFLAELTTAKLRDK